MQSPGRGRSRTQRTQNSQLKTRNSRTICVPVLIYHHVKPIRPSDNAIERGLTVVPDIFKAQLSYLSAHRFHTVSAAQLVSSIRGQAALPSNPIALTFDDGYADMYPNVYRTLRARRMTGTFFIVPKFANQARYLTWLQVEEMSRSGMDIEAHTMTHPDLTSLGASRLSRELRQSRALLQKRLHKKIRIMAYPYGAYDPAVLQAVAKSGYVAAFTTKYGRCAGPNQLLTLPRIYANRDTGEPISSQ